VKLLRTPDDRFASLPDWPFRPHYADLRDITFFGQDWGGLIGLRLVAGDAARFARVVVANTGLPTGDQELTQAFLAWQRFAAETENFDVGAIVSMGCANPMPGQVRAAYDAPFPDDTYKAGARVFPSLVPASPQDPAAASQRRAWQVLPGFGRPFLTAFSDGDPITAGGERAFLRSIPGARSVAITGAGHFLQEDAGPRLAAVIAAFIEGQDIEETK
jgi:haloalkane dehalogenase